VLEEMAKQRIPSTRSNWTSLDEIVKKLSESVYKSDEFPKPKVNISGI